METLTAANYSTAAHAPSATRALRTAEPLPTCTTTSQRSSTTVRSDERSAGYRLHSSASELSQQSDQSAMTSLTSPSSSASIDPSRASTRVPAKLHLAESQTPEERHGHSYFDREIPLASPMSITSPVATGAAKRTASGHVKNAHSLSSTPLSTTFPSRTIRRDSTSSTSSKASELAANLRTRLSYAMAKVHNGWEHKTLNEVEQLASRRGPGHRHSVSLVDQSTSHDYARHDRSEGIHRNSSYYPTFKSFAYPSKRSSAQISSHRRGLSLGQPVQLQPAAEIRTTPSSQESHRAAALSMSPPSTPIDGQSRRPPTIRTETQTAEAERDALQALFQLGSPHTSQPSTLHHTPNYLHSSQTSPLREDFLSPRRVKFARSDSGSGTRPTSSSN